MAAVHGKGTVVTINAIDISAFSNSVEWGREAETHDTTGFGSDSKTFAGGLKEGTVSISGIYDSVAGGPRGTIEPLLGTSTSLVYKPEGTGTGKPVKTVTVIVGSYSETAAVADMVSWSAEFQMSGSVANTTSP